MDENFGVDAPLIAIIAGFVVFMILGSILRKKVNQRGLIRQGQLPSDGVRIPTIEERLAGNSAWARDEIRSVGRGPMIILWILSLVWILTFGVSFIKSFSNPEMKTGGMIVLGVFAFLSVVPVYFAARFTIRYIRFGNSWCRITGKAGVLGKSLAGSIRNTNEINVTGDYTVELQCIESYTTGTGKNRKTQTNLRWQAKQVVSRAGKSIRAGIPFSFALPATSPETGDQLSRGDINWSLKMTAPVEGVDYSTMFIVPVFRVE